MRRRHTSGRGALAAIVGWALSGFALAAPAAAPARQGGASIRLEPVVSGLERPVEAVNAGDSSNRLFVLEKEGRVRVVKNGQLLAQPFLDIRERVEDGGNEQGMLGIAFHPGFEANGRFFVFYTAEAGDDDPLTVSEFAAAPGSDVAGTSERVLLRVPHPTYDNHNGGQLQFGLDGYLYIGTGDGGGANDPFANGQDKGELLAKILRVDVNSGSPYGIPPDNPFAGAAAGRDEVYAYGFRNPWRFSFDRQNGELWVADVGQNQYEEIDVVVRGANYGWSVMEGRHCRPPQTTCDMTGLAPPVFEYSHNGSNGVPGGACSITGGYVYRGTRSPSLAGTYLFADYCVGAGRLFGIRKGDQAATVFLTGSPAGPVTAFAQDEQGELYVLTDSTFGGNGSLLKIVGPAGGCALTCPQDVTAEDAGGDGGEAVQFAAPEASGDCGTVTCVPASGSTFPVGATTVTCTAGAATCSFTVTVTGPGGVAVTGCGPSAGSRKQTLDVTITGAGFAQGAVVSFGKKINVLDVTVVSPTEIRATIKVKKAKRGPRDVVVTNPGGASATGAGCFTVS
jgi:glucose/arabinose dehydrogenase